MISRYFGMLSVPVFRYCSAVKAKKYRSVSRRRREKYRFLHIMIIDNSLNVVTSRWRFLEVLPRRGDHQARLNSASLAGYPGDNPNKHATHKKYIRQLGFKLVCFGRVDLWYNTLEAGWHDRFCAEIRTFLRQASNITSLPLYCSKYRVCNFRGFPKKFFWNFVKKWI